MGFPLRTLGRNEKERGALTTGELAGTRSLNPRGLRLSGPELQPFNFNGRAWPTTASGQDENIAIRLSLLGSSANKAYRLDDSAGVLRLCCACACGRREHHIEIMTR